jgi:hypothetical protein
VLQGAPEAGELLNMISAMMKVNSVERPSSQKLVKVVTEIP